jgi:ketosteroid isomerase-like protein
MTIPAQPRQNKRMASGIVLLVMVAVCGCIASPYEVSMSPQEQQHAIALLRTAYAAFNRDDIAAAVEHLDPGIEWQEPTEFPGGGLYHGRAEVARYLSHSRAGWTEGASEPFRFIAHGDRIVVYVHARFRSKDSANWSEVCLTDVYTFRNGTPVAMRAFADHSAALRWVEMPASE